MKKLKKLIILTVAITTLLGATLTVNAKPVTPTCGNCGHTSSVTYQGVSYEFGQSFDNWWCQYCNYSWRVRQY